MDKDRCKKIFLKILFPKTILIFLLFNISLFMLLYAFTVKDCPPAAAYCSYALSAYTLVVVCARIPNIIKEIKKHLHRNKYTNRYLTEKELRIRVSLYGGLLLNICFAVFKVVMGVLYQSEWLFAMAGYNTILSIMRFILVYRDQSDKSKENDYERRIHGLNSYRVCGWLMLLLNIIISVIVAMVVFDNYIISYPGYMIYAIAAFTFYCMTMAVINMVKYWHRHNPVFSAVKRIGMAKALVSIFTLQVAMLTQFGENSNFDHRIANGATGFAVCVIITLMAALMIIGAKRDYREMEVK